MRIEKNDNLEMTIEKKAKQDTFWEGIDFDNIKLLYEELVSKYPQYKFFYNYEKYPQIYDYLIRLTLNSFGKNREVREQLPELIHNMEHFFFSGINVGIIDNLNLLLILEKLKRKNNGIRVIKFLPANSKKAYGRHSFDVLEINERKKRHPNSPDLNPDEARRLTMIHEIGHVIFNLKSMKMDIANYTKMFTKKYELKRGSLQFREKKAFFKMGLLVEDGFLMLEECLAQELSEILTYYSLGKTRPLEKEQEDLDCHFLSNLDYYGIFETPTVLLGKTMYDGDNKEILMQMIKNAINSNFVIEIIKNFSTDDFLKYIDLYWVLFYMGNLNNLEYSSFGVKRICLKNYSAQECLDRIEDRLKYYQRKRHIK